jgi:hypothetical protein
MLMVVAAWMALGALTWLEIFLEFRRSSALRPGLLELVVLMIFGPLFFLHSVLVQKKK